MVKKNFARLLILLFLLTLSGVNSHAAGQTPPYQVFIPLLKKAAAQSSFGAEIRPGKYASTVSMVSASGIYWVRNNGLLWSKVQPNNANEWNWQNVSTLESDLAQSEKTGAQTILVIRGTPNWAQLYPGHECGPMQADKISLFANFVKEAVKRYSAPPFNVSYYELWNEPDVDPTLVAADSEFGCWGNQSDDYYGGGYYADMLKQVYPALKSANSNARLLIGGLLLDCDPAGGCQAGSEKSPKFFEGMLLNGGTSYFDIVNFHGYPSYTAPGNPILIEKSFSTWASRGGVVKGKITYLRELMNQYQVNKPIFQSEGALLLRSSLGAATFEQAKADYVAWLFVRNLSEGLLGTTWFTMDGPGWLSSGLLDENQAPLPAFQALKFLNSKIAGYTYNTTINTYAGIEGFQFSKGSRKVWVLFSQDNSSHTLPVPNGFVAAYDVVGSPILANAGMFTVDHPIYLELNQ